MAVRTSRDAVGVCGKADGQDCTTFHRNVYGRLVIRIQPAAFLRRVAVVRQFLSRRDKIIQRGLVQIKRAAECFGAERGKAIRVSIIISIFACGSERTGRNGSGGTVGREFGIFHVDYAAGQEERPAIGGGIGGGIGVGIVVIIINVLSFAVSTAAVSTGKNPIGRGIA